MAMSLGVSMPWSLSEAGMEVVRQRMRVGFCAAGLCYSGLAVHDHLFGNALAAEREVTGAVVMVATVLALRRKPLGWSDLVAASVGGLTLCWVMASTASLSGVFPMHSYVAVMVTSAAAIPWGVVAQLIADGGLLLAAAWNASHVPPSALPPAREFLVLALMVGGSVVVAFIGDRQQRFAEAVEDSRKRREGERRRHLAELEERVGERTAALAAEVEERRTAQQQLELLMNALPGYIAYFDAGGRYQWINDNLQVVIARPRSTIIGASIDEFHPPLVWDRVAPYAAQALAGQAVAVEVDVPFGEHLYYVELVFIAHRGDAGQLLGAFMLARDVTARRAQEASRERTERLASLGTMAAGIAHEINNPAASILAAAEMADGMLDDEYDPAELRAVLRLMGSEAARCGAIVRSILGHATDQPASRSLHRLDAVMERAAALLRAQVTQAGAQLRVETDPTLPEIPMDPTEMLQVVMNLGTNALRAESTEIVVRTEVRADHVALVVCDNGRGMTREESERAFDPFYTTRRAGGGVGLGLSLTHAIVVRHGGRIEVRSEPGKGTTMIVELPYLPRQLDA